MKLKFVFILMSAFAVFSSPAHGQIDANPENWCRNGLFPRDGSDFRIAKIIGGKSEKVFFYGDEKDDCPAGKDCRLRSYVIPGNEVIVSRQYGDYVCAWFEPKSGSETVGWIKTKNVSFVKSKSGPVASDFVGNWSFYDNSIEIKPLKNRGTLSVSGEAFWKGLGDNIHIGEISGEVSPVGNVLKIGEEDQSEYACRASLRLVGRYLVVSDNLNCGGANVSFTGVYVR